MFERFTDKARGAVFAGRAYPGAASGCAAGPLSATGRITVTRESKQALSLALKEARALRHNYLGTEHLLLGLLTLAENNPRGEFNRATLRDLCLDTATARERVLAELTERSGT